MYRNESYTFYIYPRNDGKNFLSESQTLEFLITNGLDLNKLVKEGIGFMNDKQENMERQKLGKQHSEKETIPIPDDCKELIEDICNKIENFLYNSESKTLELDKYNSFVELLLCQEVKLRFKKMLFFEAVITDRKNRILRLTRTSSAEEWEELNIRRQDSAWKEFDAALGFSKVAKMIKDSGKLVVGHNMLLDTVHTLDAFHQQLPKEYDDFKKNCSQCFSQREQPQYTEPSKASSAHKWASSTTSGNNDVTGISHTMTRLFRSIDTKYMSWLPPLKDEVNSKELKLLLGDLSRPPYSVPQVGATTGRGFTGVEEEFHTAGYDAFVTGVVFLAMHGRLAPGRRVDAYAPVMKPYLNRLYLGRTADQGSPCMYLTGKEVLQPRDHVFYVKFPYRWKNKLGAEFTKYGTVTTEFLSQTTAVVCLSHRELAPAVLRDFAKNKKVAVTSYDVYMKKFMAQHRRSP